MCDVSWVILLYTYPQLLPFYYVLILCTNQSLPWFLRCPLCTRHSGHLDPLPTMGFHSTKYLHTTCHSYRHQHCCLEKITIYEETTISVVYTLRQNSFLYTGVLSIKVGNLCTLDCRSIGQQSIIPIPGT